MASIAAWGWTYEGAFGERAFGPSDDRRGRGLIG
jgi:hypothetical protein